MSTFAEHVDIATIQPIIAKCRDVFFQCEHVLDVYLVGSAATKQLNTHSDLDFIIVVDDQSGRKPFQKYLRPYLPLSRDWEIELVIVPLKEFDRLSVMGGICYDALKEGVKLPKSGAIKW